MWIQIRIAQLAAGIICRIYKNICNENHKKIIYVLPRVYGFKIYADFNSATQGQLHQFTNLNFSQIEFFEYFQREYH